MQEGTGVKNEQRPVVIVSIVTALCLLGDSMLYIVLPLYWKEAGLTSLWEVGVLLSVNRFVRLPLNPFIGWLYKSITLRTGLIAAVLLGALTTIGYGVWHGFWLWLVLRCTWGLAWSLLRMGGFFTVISYSCPSNRGHLMGIYNGLYRLGSLFGMLLGGVLAPIIGLSQVALLFGMASFIGIPFITAYISREKASETASQPAHKKIQASYLSKPVIKVVVSGLWISLLFQGLLTSTLSFVIDSHYSQTILLFGLVISATTLSGTLQAARWVWEPFLASRFGRWSDGPRGRVPLLIVSLLCSAVGFALIPIQLPLFFWIVVILLVMVAATSLTTLIDALASDLAKHSAVITVMTIHSVALDLGAALGPMLGYWFIELENGLLFTYLGGAFMFLLITCWWYHPKSRGKTQTVQTAELNE